MRLVRPETITDANLTSNVAETEVAWSGVTAYAVADVVRRTVGNVHRRYVSAQNGNTNHDPATDDGTWWTDEGPTNRFNCLDDAIQTQTTNADSIQIAVALETTSRADTVALLNVSGTSAQITVTDPVDGVVSDETYSLVSDSGITDWFAYFYEPIARKRDLVVIDLPPYSGTTVSVAITESGATVGLGALVIGQAKRLGDLQYGVELGVQDFSRKDEDEFGNLVVVERAYRRRASFSVIVPNGSVDDLINVLADYRATPALYIGSERFSSTAVFGFYKDASTVIAYPDRSLLSISIESLT